ncbi:recombinase family protein [Pedobacter sp. PWIIR3]
MAIEQPLDLTIPEQKLMLDVYFSMPEVENDRRGLNVKYRLRPGRKEGRLMGMALPSYKNRTREYGSKYIALNQPEADHMKWCFETIARDIHPTERIWSIAKEKGMKCSRMSFWGAILNPIYCGKILVPKMGNEEAQIVKALHEPLVNDVLFNEVQDVLDGRKENQFIKLTTPNNCR